MYNIYPFTKGGHTKHRNGITRPPPNDAIFSGFHSPKCILISQNISRNMFINQIHEFINFAPGENLMNPNQNEK